MSIDFNDKAIKERLPRAQRRLDIMIATDSTAYVPIAEGVLRNSVDYSTPGEVSWNTPYAHYQYAGKDMIGVETKRHWAKQYETKEYNGKLLTYREPEASSEWFEKAKKIHISEWLMIVGGILDGSSGK